MKQKIDVIYIGHDHNETRKILIEFFIQSKNIE
jgi:hypothetical protein